MIQGGRGARKLASSGASGFLFTVVALLIAIGILAAMPAHADAADLKVGTTAAQKATSSAKRAAAAKTPPVAEGIYVIAATKSSGQVIDIDDGSTANGANALIWAKSASKLWQKWRFVWKNGSYEIVNVNSGKRLAVEGASRKSGANVIQQSNTGKSNQRWVVTPSKDGKYVTIKSALSGMCLDMTGGSTKNGTNIRVYKGNHSKAQRFTLKSARIIDAGTYTLGSRLGRKQTLDIPNNSTAQGVQAITWPANDGINQRFRVRVESGGNYSFQSVLSGLFLTEDNGKVVQRKWRGSKQQLWSATCSSGIVLSNVASGKKLTVAGGRAANKAKIVTSSKRLGSSQCWSLVPKSLIPSSCFRVRNGVGTWLDVTGASYRNKANIETWTKSNSGAQCFKIEAVSGGYRFRNTRSFKVLDVSGASKANGGNVIQWEANGGKNQVWKASIDRSGYITFTNVNSGKVLDVAGGSSKAGANVIQRQSNGSKSQGWKLTPMARYSLSGDETLDRRVASVLSTHGSLRSAYDYVAKEYAYREGSRFWGGAHFLSDSTTISFANEMYRRGSGNCYRFASLFSWLARGLGYSTNVVSGWVPSRSGGKAPHGWVEVYSNGTHVCDPDMYNDLRNYDWFMRTYANAPVSYGSW